MSETCVCGGSVEQPNSDCERCRLIAINLQLLEACKAATAAIEDADCGLCDGLLGGAGTDNCILNNAYATSVLTNMRAAKKQIQAAIAAAESGEASPPATRSLDRSPKLGNGDTEG